MNVYLASKHCQQLLIAAALCTVGATSSQASPVTFEANVATADQIRLDFADGSKHFVAMVRREGSASGGGPLGDTRVSEYGRHDIVPGVGGNPSGYLVFSAGDQDIAYLRYTVRAVYVPGADGKQIALDGGIWEVVGGAGRFKGLRGAGTVRIRALSPKDRRFILDGEMVQSGQ